MVTLAKNRDRRWPGSNKRQSEVKTLVLVSQVLSLSLPSYVMGNVRVVSPEGFEGFSDGCRANYILTWCRASMYQH